MRVQVFVLPDPISFNNYGNTISVTRLNYEGRRFISRWTRERLFKLHASLNPISTGPQAEDSQEGLRKKQ
jgi:hypothetical protein